MFLVADWADHISGGNSLFPAGPLDEIAHLTTMLLVLWTLGPEVFRRLAAPALVASVAIDFDHIPDLLGYDFFTEHTPRPYTHSLSSIVVVLVIALLWRRRRDVLIATALGLAVHFIRDLAEPGSGVSLLWPLSDHSFSLPHAVYLLGMAAAAAIVAIRIMIGAVDPP